MSYIQDSLSVGEEVVALFKIHWTSYIPVVVLTLMIVPIPMAIHRYLVIRHTERGVTNKRVILKKGIVSRVSDEMKLSSIETVEIDQSVAGRILRFGNVKVTGRGINDLVFEEIANPLEVKKQIESVAHPIAVSVH